MHNRKILIVTYDDLRERYKFILEPMLLITPHETISVLTLPKNIARTIRHLYHVFRSKQYHTIILSSPEFYTVWAVLLKYLIKTKVKIIVRTGGDLYKNSKSLIIERLKSGRWLTACFHLLTRSLQFCAMRFCDEYILVSDYLLEYKRYAFIKNSRYYIIPQTKTVKTHNLDISIKNPQNIKILTVTNLQYYEKYTGVLMLIEALQEYMTKLNSHRPDVKISFYILGAGNFGNKIRQKINKLTGNTNLKIFYEGFQKNVDLYYNSSDLFVYWSYMDLLPNVVLEAQAHGLPVLFFNRPELIRSFRQTAIPFCDKQDLISKLQSLVDDRQLFQKVARKGISNIQNNYTVNAVAKLFKPIVYN